MGCRRQISKVLKFLDGHSYDHSLIQTPQLAHITIPPWSSCYPKDKAFQSKELVNKITHSLVALINNDQLNCLHKFLPLLFLYPPAKSLRHPTAYPFRGDFSRFGVDIRDINPHLFKSATILLQNLRSGRKNKNLSIILGRSLCNVGENDSLSSSRRQLEQHPAILRECRTNLIDGGLLIWSKRYHLQVPNQSNPNSHQDTQGGQTTATAR